MRFRLGRRSEQPPTAIGSLEDATALLSRPEVLREQAQRDGFLFFRGLLEPSSVLDVRDDMANVLRRYGFVQAGATNDLLVADVASYEASMEREGDERYAGTAVTPAVYSDIQHLQSFHALSLHPSLVHLYEQLFATDVLVHPRTVARVRVPSPRNIPTPPHQDFIYNQGTTDTWTAWIPLGDCPIDQGGLALLAGSHARGMLDYARAAGAGGYAAQLSGVQGAWMQADYRAGDVLAFSSRCVHKSLHNTTNLIRLSVDFRYQPLSAPVVEASLRPHFELSTWDEIYSGWDESYPRYHWREKQLRYATEVPVDQVVKVHGGT